MSCPPRSDQDKIKQAPNYLGSIVDSMGITSCKKSNQRDTSELLIEGELDIGPGGLGGKASMSAQGKTESVRSNSIGCEQVTAIAKTNIDTIDKVKCTLNETKGSISNVVKAYNKVKILGEEIDTTRCTGGFKIDQKNKIKINSSISFTPQQVEKMVDDVVKTVKDTADILSKSESGYAATEQGQKTIKNIVEQSNTSDYKANIKKTILEITNVGEAGNEIELGSDKTKKVILGGANCTIEQGNIIDVMATMVISDVLNQTFEQFKTENLEYMDKVVNESKTEGVGEFKDLQSMFVSKGKQWMYVIIGVGVVIVLIVVLILVFKMISGKSSDNNSSESSDVETSE